MALTKYNYNSFDVTPVASKAMGFNSGANGLTTVTEGDMVLIKTVTASSDSTLDFLDGTSDVVFDSTYPIYVFKFINIHPATDRADTGTNTSYNQTITSTFFVAYHDEGDTNANVVYDANYDQAQGTSFQHLGKEVGSDNDQGCSGSLTIYQPSSSTFAKHFIATTQVYVAPTSGTDFSQQMFCAGYFNTTTALTRVQFKMSSGNIDAGQIKLYGIKDS